jgi:O-antigen/teichoic acid export membrane protein
MNGRPPKALGVEKWHSEEVSAGGRAARPGSMLRTRAVRAAFLTGMGSKIGTTVLGLFSVAIAVRSAGNVEYGVITAVVGLVGLFGFLDFGIGNATIFDISQLHAQKDDFAIQKLNANSLAFLFAVSVLIIAIVVPTVLFASPDLFFKAPGIEDHKIRISLIIFAVATAVAVPATFGSRLALGVQKGSVNNYVGLAAAGAVFLGVGLCSLCAADLYFFIATFAFIPVLANAAQTVCMMKSDGGRYRPDWSALDFIIIRRLVVRGLPFMALAFAGAVTYQTDTLVIIYVIGAGGAATFGVTLRIFTGLTGLFAGGLQQMWASTAHALADGDMPWVRRSFARIFFVTMALYSIASIALVIFGQLLIEVWAGSTVVPDKSLLAAFAVWSLYAFGMSQLSMLLNGADMVRVQALSACLMAAANVPLTIFLTGAIGLPGPLYASLLCHCVFVGVPAGVMVRRLLRAKTD